MHEDIKAKALSCGGCICGKREFACGGSNLVFSKRKKLFLHSVQLFSLLNVGIHDDIFALRVVLILCLFPFAESPHILHDLQDVLASVGHRRITETLQLVDKEGECSTAFLSGPVSQSGSIHRLHLIDVFRIWYIASSLQFRKHPHALPEVSIGNGQVPICSRHHVRQPSEVDSHRVVFFGFTFNFLCDGHVFGTRRRWFHDTRGLSCVAYPDGVSSRLVRFTGSIELEPLRIRGHGSCFGLVLLVHLLVPFVGEREIHGVGRPIHWRVHDVVVPSEPSEEAFHVA
mmetsp:Transcript_7032/g.43194  ORF Transcript_7032/g.43194 Transcript_7032/m.43194 type:complete len:286 (+) Transcript_7032:2782-3639(+)